MSVDGTPIYTYSCDLVASCEGGRFHAVVQTTQRASGTSKTGVWLAQMAHDEAASASAFVALEVELRAHHAPADLRRRVLEAAADEVRHASMIRTLAEPRGGVVPPSVIGDVPPRDLFAIAIENVVEGCVKETWLAMRAHVQAEVATDPQIAAALRVIAVDETRHAELARELDGWMRSKLSPADNRRLNAARDEAVAQLTLRIDQGDEMSFAEAGLPSAEEQARLVRALTAALWT
jgi:rubrerythrin